MFPPRGTTLLVSLLVVYLVGLSGRVVFREKILPAVVVEKSRKISLLLDDGFELKGVNQFYDDIDLAGVIELTVPAEMSLRFARSLPQGPILDGSRLDVLIKDGEIIDVYQGWMPAPQRVALGIRLHPDRMTREDWEVLPGIGALLAARIEENRQKNGDFFSLDGLKRVPGIGSKSIERWREFF